MASENTKLWLRVNLKRKEKLALNLMNSNLSLKAVITTKPMPNVIKGSQWKPFSYNNN